MSGAAAPLEPSVPAATSPALASPTRFSRRDLAVAATVAVASGAFDGWQALSMPATVEQVPKYPLTALQILHGVRLGERLIDFSPLYLELHAIAGATLADPFIGVLIIQASCLGLAAAFLFLAIRRVAAAPIALAGAAALVFDRSVVTHTYVFEPELLLLLLVTAWLFFAARRGLVAASAGGLALALAVLTRPSVLPLAAAVPAAGLLVPPARRRALAAAGLSLLPVAMALLVLAYRNHAATDSWSPVVMNPGTVFFDGNNPLGPGFVAAYPPVVRDLAASHPEEGDFEHAVYRQLARGEMGRTLSVGEVNRFWAAKALHYLRDEPGAALRRFGRKLLFAFHGYRWNDRTGANTAERVLEERRIPATPLALVSALAIAGAGFGLRRWRELLPAYALLASQLAVILATYASARQRLALLPALCLFAALGASRLARGGWRALWTGCGVLLLAAVLGRETGLMREHRHLYLPATAGTEPSPDGGPALMSQAIALFNEGRLEEAAPLFQALRRVGRDSLRGDPAYFLGRIAARQGRRPEAVALMQEALVRSPGHPAYLAQLAALTDEPAHAARLYRYLDRADARYFLGDALLEAGRAEEAAAALEQLVAEVPEHEAGRALLQRALTARAAARAAPGPSPGATP